MSPWQKLISTLRRRRHRRGRRILWILNHKTLLPAEVPILESLGFEVLVPGKTPAEGEFLSATGRHAGTITIPTLSLERLRAHGFYTDSWPPDLIKTINDEFDLVVTAVYEKPLVESLRHFRGAIIARVFGRELELTYTGLFSEMRDCADLIEKAGARFMFAQAYPNIASLEDDFLKKRAHTIGCSIPHSIWQRRNTWSPKTPEALFVCPRFDSHPYLRRAYDLIKSEFGDLPHKIIGAQVRPVDDVSVLGYVDDETLFSLYANAPVFVYPSTEARHLHYTPLEAAIVGAPVLYMKGAMLSTIAGPGGPGECVSYQQMRAKAERLLSNDPAFSYAIISEQENLLRPFSPSYS